MNPEVVNQKVQTLTLLEIKRSNPSDPKNPESFDNHFRLDPESLTKLKKLVGSEINVIVNGEDWDNAGEGDDETCDTFQTTTNGKLVQVDEDHIVVKGFSRTVYNGNPKSFNEWGWKEHPVDYRRDTCREGYSAKYSHIDSLIVGGQSFRVEKASEKPEEIAKKQIDPYLELLIALNGGQLSEGEKEVKIQELTKLQEKIQKSVGILGIAIFQQDLDRREEEAQSPREVFLQSLRDERALGFRPSPSMQDYNDELAGKLFDESDVRTLTAIGAVREFLGTLEQTQRQ